MSKLMINENVIYKNNFNNNNNLNKKLNIN